MNVMKYHEDGPYIAEDQCGFHVTLTYISHVTVLLHDVR